MRQALGGREKLPADWVTIETVIKETSRELFSISAGQKTDDKETWW